MSTAYLKNNLPRKQIDLGKEATFDNEMDLEEKDRKQPKGHCHCLASMSHHALFS